MLEESGWGATEGVKERTGGGRERQKMHKQMLALGIDAISSVSQLMTNSTEKRGEQKESSNGVSKSKREKQRGWVRETRSEGGTRHRPGEERDRCIHD